MLVCQLKRAHSPSSEKGLRGVLALARQMLKMGLFYSKKAAPEAEHLEKPLGLLKRLGEKCFQCELIDTDGWSKHQFSTAYGQAMTASMLNNHGIRRAFGSRTDGRIFFATKIPALLVFNERNLPVAVFPHLKGKKRVEIPDYLRTLLAEHGEGPGSSKGYSTGSA